MNKATALKAYRRVSAWEVKARTRLNDEILVPYFGRCMCRMRNCAINYEQGRQEAPTKGKNHAQLYQLAKRYEYRMLLITERYTRLSRAFAQYF
jgi:hypothetical protein